MASLSDNFTRANSTGLGASWTNVFGRFDVVSNQASSTTRDANNITLALHNTPMDSDHCHVEAVAVTQTASSQAVVAHSNSTATDYYIARVGANGDLGIYRTTAGTAALISTTSTGSRNTTVAVQLDVYVNSAGNVVLTATYGARTVSVIDSSAGRLKGATYRYVGIRVSDTVASRLMDTFAAFDVKVVTGGAATLVTAAAAGAGRKLGRAGAAALAQAVAAGAGRKTGRGGALARAEAHTAGAGRKRSLTGSVAAALATVTAFGRRLSRGGSAVMAQAHTGGAGRKTARAGSAAAATVTATGAGAVEQPTTRTRATATLATARPYAATLGPGQAVPVGLLAARTYTGTLETA